MKQVVSSEKIPIKMWLDDMEDSALLQAMNLANLPFAFHHIAIMPDSHSGYGMPIGGVLATDGVVIPNAVGVDIGCGMCAMKTTLKYADVKDSLKDILGEIRKTIPVGFNHHKNPIDKNQMPLPPFGVGGQQTVCEREFEKARYQLGTLGGGNHFIEIQKDEENNTWVMIHSGSRNLGKQVAEHYNNLAIELNEKWHSSIPKKQELAFLPLNSEEGQDYMKEMQYCVNFALANRHQMMFRVIQILESEMWKKGISFEIEPIINIAHNYAQLEKHFGKTVVIHRKGATLARIGLLGIIPGSQGTSSYIVEGLSNRDSFESCSHGAGRKMGRGVAQRTLDLGEEQKKLDDQGILHSVRGVKDLDEAPGSYKSIDEVMDNQKDLVIIKTKLTPLAVVKG